MRKETSFTAPTVEREDEVRLGFLRHAPGPEHHLRARFVGAAIVPTYHAVHVDAVQ